MGVLGCPDLGAPAKSLGKPLCFINVWCHAILGDCGNFLVEVAWVNVGGGCPDLGAPAPSPAGCDGFPWLFTAWCIGRGTYPQQVVCRD